MSAQDTLKPASPAAPAPLVRTASGDWEGDHIVPPPATAPLRRKR